MPWVSIFIHCSHFFVGMDGVVVVRCDLQPNPFNHNLISEAQVEYHLFNTNNVVRKDERMMSRWKTFFSWNLEKNNNIIIKREEKVYHATKRTPMESLPQR